MFDSNKKSRMKNLVHLRVSKNNACNTYVGSHHFASILGTDQLTAEAKKSARNLNHITLHYVQQNFLWLTSNGRRFDATLLAVCLTYLIRFRIQISIPSFAYKTLGQPAWFCTFLFKNAIDISIGECATLTLLPWSNATANLAS